MVSEGTVGASATPDRGVARALLRAVRPRQWTKNLLVVAAPLAAGQLGDRDVLVATLLAFVAFCLAASAVYLVNDVADRERTAPTRRKRLRPIAAGELPRPVALVVAGCWRRRGSRWARSADRQLVALVAAYLGAPGALRGLAQARAGDRHRRRGGRVPDAGGGWRPRGRRCRSRSGSCWSPASARCSSWPASATPSCTRSARGRHPAVAWCATPTPTSASSGARGRAPPSCPTACGPSRVAGDSASRGTRSRSCRSSSACSATPSTSTPGPPPSPRTSCSRDRVLQVIGVAWLVSRLPWGCCRCTESPACSPAGAGPRRPRPPSSDADRRRRRRRRRTAPAAVA